MSSLMSNQLSSGQQTIDELCDRFNLDQTIKSSAITKYEQISKHKSFTFTLRQTKTILSSVCVYLSVGDDHKPLTINKICSAINCSLNDFGKVYNQVIKEFPDMKNEFNSVEELAEYELKDLKVDDSERQALVQRTIELIRIVRKCWLIEGRSPHHIIFAAAFLAWKSLKPAERTKLKLNKFCDQLSIDYKHTTQARVSEFFSALSNLGRKIPGKESFRFTQQNIAIYIEDIINYCHSLIYDLSTEANKRFQAISKTSDATHDSVYIRQTRSSAKRQNKTLIDDQMATDDEISDSEINLYIRSEEEVKKIKKLRKYMDLDKEDEDLAEKNVKEMKKYIKIDKFV